MEVIDGIELPFMWNDLANVITLSESWSQKRMKAFNKCLNMAS